MFSLRLATRDDIQQIVELRIKFIKEIRIDTPTDKMDEYRKVMSNYLKKEMSSGNFIAWLAISNNEIIATSGLITIQRQPQLWNMTGQEVYIMNMYTKPEWRRKGIGTAILEKLIEEARNRGIEAIKLHATPMGKTLYEKRGFKIAHPGMYLYLE
ncbi:MAG: GNAT family N-acetyltransferase [Candidatus Heimdallarchaeota archaeon]|nr:GNAT family N-acetyltransferase [Candidatus Heimdallarchaeota archaeon]MCK5158603.1 GNAT family N-acetyltransferase [Candidatus Heimdallarchaeota archaeon]MCK5184445.1 GNAT family N-acetyltransferase [Candidatus Heimdallarchaeota archaeon]MCK5297808.1 GNAT family N-acetyltransferase [Candidatus Heimdallarchaeota archaeon]